VLIRWSFAGEFEVEGAECDSEGLEEGHGEGDVEVELVLAHAPELHVDLVVVVLVYQLEVFNRSLINTTVEIQHKCLHL
jgi:hypothetical protein